MKLSLQCIGYSSGSHLFSLRAWNRFAGKNENMSINLIHDLIACHGNTVSCSMSKEYWNIFHSAAAGFRMSSKQQHNWHLQKLATDCWLTLYCRTHKYDTLFTKLLSTFYNVAAHTEEVGIMNETTFAVSLKKSAKNGMETK